MAQKGKVMGNLLVQTKIDEEEEEPQPTTNPQFQGKRVNGPKV
jgi:hypothetical protein